MRASPVLYCVIAWCIRKTLAYPLLEVKSTTPANPSCLVVHFGGAFMNLDEQDQAWNMPYHAANASCLLIQVVPKSVGRIYTKGDADRAATLIANAQSERNLTSSQTLLIGYSRGGELVWDLWIEYPHLFDQGVILSGICTHPRCKSIRSIGRPKIWYIYGRVDNLVQGHERLIDTMRLKEPWDFTVWEHSQTIPQGRNMSQFVSDLLYKYTWIKLLQPLTDLPNAAVHAVRSFQYITFLKVALNGYGGHCIPNAHTTTHNTIGWRYNRGCERDEGPVVEIGELVLQYAGFRR